MTASPRQQGPRVIIVGVALALATTVLACLHPASSLNQSIFGAAAAWLVLLLALPTLAAIWLSAAGWGWLVRRALGEPERGGVVLQLASGLALQWWLAWLLAWSGWLNMPIAWGLCAVGGAGLALQVRQAQRQARTNDLRVPWLPWSCALLGPPIALLLTAAACPVGTLWRVEAFGYDATSYHLQIPAEWLAAGRMTRLDHNVYGFLPGLTEVGYLHAATMLGSVYAAIEVTQLLHASVTVLAAITLAMIVRRAAEPRTGAGPDEQAGDDQSGAFAGAAVAALVLSVPWVLITGSLPYNDMAALAFAAAALLAGCGATPDPRPAAKAWPRLVSAAWVGVLGGAAILAKPTAGPMLVAPALAALMLPPLHAASAASWRLRLGRAGVAGLVTLLVLSPWLIRNTAWTGNPVFPMAASALGAGHWEATHVERWARAHGPEGAAAERMARLAERWLFDTGYGALGGDLIARWRSAGVPAPGHDITRMAQGLGVPAVWLAALAGAAAAWSAPARRRWVSFALAMLAWQLAFWLVATHLQSRFLLFALAPAGVLIGLGLIRLTDWCGGRRGFAGLVATALVIAVWSVALRQFRDQLPLGYAPAQVVGSLPPNATQTRDSLIAHALNQVPAPARIYMLADANRLIYIRVPFEYHTAFDPDPLARLMRVHEGDATAITTGLRQRGITHVWANWSELDRLSATYGVDPPLSRAAVSELAQRAEWRPIMSAGEPQPIVTLYQLP